MYTPIYFALTPRLPMRFDEQFLERVRDSTSIVELIGSYVQLKKRGKDYAALCPFHSEKTPSFWVSESKQIFKCFGCGAGGDAYKFLMLMENLAFTDAVARLAQRQGIPLPQGRDRIPEDENKRRLMEIMDLAAGFFREALENHPASAEARKHLEKRNISSETVQTFELGYAPPGNELVRFLKKRGIDTGQMLACGLAVETAGGQPRDKFRHRIMFPIRDLSGKVIAFGGRALGDSTPKYLNSPETVLYHKGNHLYGLDKARDAIRRAGFAILVEGYFDCIVPFQSGFQNTVASLGTSLTENQVRLLGRHSRNVVINFDPDSAGLAAALRSIDLFLQQGFRVNVLSLPDGHDPDTFVRANGAAGYQQKLKNSTPFIEFALNRFLKEKKDPFSPKAKQETVSQILPYLLKIPNRIERSEYASLVAARLDIDVQLILAEMRKASGKQAGGEKPLLFHLGKLSLAERTLIAGVFDEQWSEVVLPLLSSELFDGLSTAPIFEKVIELRQLNQKINVITLRKLLGEGDCRELLESTILNASEIPLTQEAILGSVRALKERQIERETFHRQEAIRREAGLGLSSPTLIQLVREKEESARRKQQRHA
ncbi:MAG TPA: DNA primase [Acidobacteriota bacterium]|nr:DNA primase [Acidobacteriota bacterium]